MDREIRESLIEKLDALRRVQEERKQAEDGAKEYLAYVQAKIEADLEGVREREKTLRAEIEYAITHHNDGKTFKVPGLGSATVSKRTNLVLTDEKLFLDEYQRRRGSAFDLYDQRLNRTRVKEAAKRALDDDGEILPGIEQVTNETLSIRF